MQNNFGKSKTAAIAIALLLIISIGASMVLIPTATAHTPAYKIATYALVEAMPHTTGVGQGIVIYAFLGNAPPPGAAETTATDSTTTTSQSPHQQAKLQPNTTTPF